ncbi:MAG: BatA domain-containing protein [Bacteroidales bacterium]|nr:BatA domain-containing protein [Bacteroidales bacterium]
MFDLFVNPWSLIAGLVLVSVPVIIHLINRMRYKRIRWAAMEFLLKAQKRMRRKMILEQLLLLLLRMLLVALMGLLVGRFMGCNDSLLGTDKRSTSHIVIIDDTPSMTDGFRSESGATSHAFEQAKKVLVEQIVPAAAQATTPQSLELTVLSDLKTTRSFERLNPTTNEEIRSYLGAFQANPIRVSPVAGLRRAQELIATQGARDVGRVVHFLSDFRAVDWSEDGEAIKQAVAELTAEGVQVHFVDVAHPFRKDEKRAPLHNDNVGILELRPAKLTVARYEPLEFVLRVKNFGAQELKDVRFAIKVNGDENKGRSVIIPTLSGNAEQTARFELTFDQVGTEEAPLDRFSLVSATLETGENGGIGADNVRHAVVEVRERLPILIVEGRPALRDQKDGDAFYLKRIFTNVLGGFSWVDGTPRDLEQLDLTNFSFILLVNVPGLSETAVQNLERYVRDGGGTGFFLGPDVNPRDYTKLLYRNGEGVFPVPLPDQPSPELSAEELLARKFRILEKKLVLRDPDVRKHPALNTLYTDERGNLSVKDAEQFEKYFGFVAIKRYWPVQRLGKWRDDPTITELYCLPNDQPMSAYEAEIRRITDGLPVEDPEFSRAKEVLTQLRDQLRRTALSSEPLSTLADQLDRLLADQRNEGDAAEALLREVWSHAKMADLRTEATRLRDRVKFGNPLYLAKEFGRGRVTAFLSTAGETWTDWPSEPPGNASYSPVISAMGNYLSGGGADENRSVGDTLTWSFDPTQYTATVGRTFLTHVPAKNGGRGTDPNPAPRVDLKEQTMVAQGGKLQLVFGETTQPGAYLFRLTALRASPAGGQSSEIPEYRAAVFNTDTVREGDLRRVSRDDVQLLAPGAQLHSPEETDWLEKLKNKKTDWSETGWIFLLLFLVLLAEQALAVRFSHHSRASDVDAAAPSAAAVMHRLSRTAMVPDAETVAKSV